MTTLDWVLLSIPLVLIWVPALLFLGGDLLHLFRDKRKQWRLARQLKRDGRAYRDVEAIRPRPLDLSEPLGRPRLGMEEEE